MELLDQLKQSLSEVWTDIIHSIPFSKILGAIATILIGLLFIRLFVGIVKRTLKFVKADKLDDKLNEIELFGSKKFNFSVINISVKLLKWLLYALLIFIITDILDLSIVSDGLKGLLSYMPKLFTALVIFILGLLFANFVKKSLQTFFDSMDLTGSKMISQTVFSLLLVFVSITALNQAGVHTDIITNSITMLIASFLFAFSIALGLGAKEVVGDLLRTFYARKTFEIGGKIKFKNVIYEVDAIDNLSVTLKNDEKTVVVPIKEIVENQIEIEDDDQ